MPNAINDCKHPGESDTFCSRCGQLLAGADGVDWILERGNDSIKLNQFDISDHLFDVSLNETIKLTASNKTLIRIPIEVSLDSAGGINISESVRGEIELTPKGSKSLTLQVTDKDVYGRLRLKSKTGPRHPLTWWEPTSWVELPLPEMEQWVVVSDEEWSISVVEAIYFLPGVKTQSIRVWNHSVRQRELTGSAPPNYSIGIWSPNSNTDFRRTFAVSVPPGSSVDVRLNRVGMVSPLGANPPIVKIADRSFPIRHIEDKAQVADTSPLDAVVAIDFGTRNTRIRVLWLNGNIGHRNTVSVAPLEEENDEWFPSTILFESKTGHVIRAGRRAITAIEEDDLLPGWIPVTDLKTRLRNNLPVPPGFDEKVTTQSLLNAYFAWLLNHAHDYIQGEGVADSIRDLSIMYVACYPILDGETKQEEYKKLLETAMITAGIHPDKLRLVPEPTAALVYFAHEHPDMIRGLREEDYVAIVDSGGGTTDITRAKFITENGRPTPTDLTSYVLKLNRIDLIEKAYRRFMPVQADRQQEEDQFGGDVLDIATAYVLSDDIRQQNEENPILLHDVYVPPINLWSSDSQATPQPENTWILTRSRLIKEGLSVNDEVHLNGPERKPDDPNYYVYPFRGSHGESTPFNDLYITESGYRSHVIVPVLGETVDQTTKSPERPALVLCVGGTSISKLVREKFHYLLFQSSSLKDDDTLEKKVRLNAVIEGAARYFADFIKPIPLVLAVDFDHIIVGDIEEPVWQLPKTIGRIPQTMYTKRIEIPSRIWKPQLIRYRDKATSATHTSSSIRMGGGEFSVTSDILMGSVGRDKQTASNTHLSRNEPADNNSHEILAQGYFDGRRIEHRQARLKIDVGMEFGVRCILEVREQTLVKHELWSFPLFGREM